MTRTRRQPVRSLAATLAACVLACVATSASGQRLLEKDEIRQLNGVELLEQQGAKLPMDAVFTTADGKDVALAQYFLDDKPTILVLAYYECPIVCPTVLKSLSNTLNELDYSAGKDFRVLVISFDHKERTTQALNKRDNFYTLYTRASEDSSVREGIEFFTGSEESITRLSQSVGYAFNEIQGGEYAHPVSLMAISPKGVLTRYMYGYDYPPRDMKLTLIDASEGTIATSLGDKLLGFCFRYDPLTGSYSMVAFRVMQVGAALSVVVLAIFLTLLFLGDRVRRRAYLRSQSKDEASAPSGDSIIPSKSAAIGAASGSVS